METGRDAELRRSDSQEDAQALAGHPLPPGTPHSPLQFLAILNMLAALVYISQASSTRVLPLKGTRGTLMSCGN